MGASLCLYLQHVHVCALASRGSQQTQDATLNDNRVTPGLRLQSSDSDFFFSLIKVIVFCTASRRCLHQKQHDLHGAADSCTQTFCKVHPE